MEIEKGRHRDIDRLLRKCRFCPNCIEDEYHFLLVCKQYEDLRYDYLPNKYFERPNLHKLTILMSSKKEALIKNIALYIYYANLRSKHVAIEYVTHVPYCILYYMLYLLCCGPVAFITK